MTTESSYSAPSPAASSSSSNPRKRARPSDMSAEERKEARAQRNRIAAQCSRDRRKLQFAELEARVNELEEENRRLRAGAVVEPPKPKVVQKSTEQESREKENEELRERVRQLEKAWENGCFITTFQFRGKHERVEPASVSCRLAQHPFLKHSTPVSSYSHGFNERVGSPPSTGGVRRELFIERFSVPAAGQLDLAFHVPTELDTLPINPPNTTQQTTNENVLDDEWLNAVLQPSALEQEASGSPWNASSAGSVADSDPIMSPLIIDDLNASIENGEVEMERLLKLLPEEGVDLRFDSLVGQEQSTISPLVEWTWLGESAAEVVGAF
ncbi:bZIP transcription factor [Rhizoctonia solani AG-3 Rhs1AP]|uniref:X-box-binding protein 1 n=2 Tax=Rhizoctonia solani AG-3 TaxID=1086053 RepID=A0A074S7N7_9AGAM|nr:bZIP transcription factor [Rhizoctonia solani AG-3 Rhs1AP]KEP55416.1 bZIP transcription factor [Rhizoctonia solani 123E]